jgi:cytidylate kinase
MNRTTSPLRPAEEAICIDTSADTIEAVLKKMAQHLH